MPFFEFWNFLYLNNQNPYQNKENLTLENFSHVPSQSISTANSSRGNYYHDYFHPVFVLPVLKIHISKLYDMNCLYKLPFTQHNVKNLSMLLPESVVHSFNIQWFSFPSSCPVLYYSELSYSEHFCTGILLI